MAARLRLRHQEDVKNKIRASQLVKFLQEHALDGREGSKSRVEAAKFLLSKIIANPPQAVEHSGPDGEEIQASVTVRFGNGGS